MMLKLAEAIKILPIFIFMLYARLNGMTELAWKNAFFIGGIAAIFVVTIQLYKKILIDRLVLGINLFLLLGAVAFLSEWDHLLDYYQAHKGAVLLSCIFVIGLITTVFTSAGFIGVKSEKKEKIKIYSYILLFINIATIVISTTLNSYGIIASVIAPFILLKLCRDTYVEKIKK